MAILVGRMSIRQTGTTLRVQSEAKKGSCHTDITFPTVNVFISVVRLSRQSKGCTFALILTSLSAETFNLYLQSKMTL